MKKCSGCGKYFDDKYDVCPSCGQICPVVNVVDLTKVKRYHFNFIHNKKIWITVAAVKDECKDGDKIFAVKEYFSGDRCLRDKDGIYNASP